MIDRRTFLGTAALALLAAPRLAEGWSGTGRRVPRVGVLGETNPIPWVVSTPAADIECRWADAEGQSLDELASQLLALNVDVLVALGGAPAHAASQRTMHTPIVAVGDADFEDDAALPRLAQSVENLTWVSALSESALAWQRLRMLGQLVPGLRRVAAIFDPDSTATARTLAQPPPGADVRGIPARSVEDVEDVLRAAKDDGVNAALILLDTSFTVHARRLAEVALAIGLPAAYGAPAFVDAGGLLAVSGDTSDVIHRTATVVRSILAGQSPAALSPPPPRRPHVAINIATAKRLGVTVPSTLLARADVLAAR